MSKKENKAKKKAVLAAAKERSDKDAEIASRLSNRQRLTVILAILISWFAFLTVVYSTIVLCRDYSGVLAVFTWTIYVLLMAVVIGFPSAIISCIALYDALRGNRSTAIDSILVVLPEFLKNTPTSETDSNEVREHQVGTSHSGDGPLEKGKGLAAEKLLMYFCAAVIVIVVITGIAVAPLPIPLRIGLFLATSWLIAMQHFLLASFCDIRNELQIEITIDHVVATFLTNIALITIGFGFVYLFPKDGGQEIPRLAVTLIPLLTTASGWFWTHQILGVNYTFDEAFFSMSAVGSIPTFTVGMPLLFVYLYATGASLTGDL